MTTIHIHTTVERDGEVYVSNLPVKRGQVVELHIYVAHKEELDVPKMTAQQLAESDIVGMWQDRNDIVDSLSFARQLRVQAQRRER